jgi:hypothetical protein
VSQEIEQEAARAEAAYAERVAARSNVKPDLINSPPHYQSGGLEAIDVIEAFDLDFCLGNACKYILRAGRKTGEAPLKDLKKARWYLNRTIERLEAAEYVESEELPAEVVVKQNGESDEARLSCPCLLADSHRDLVRLLDHLWARRAARDGAVVVVDDANLVTPNNRGWTALEEGPSEEGPSEGGPNRGG